MAELLPMRVVETGMFHKFGQLLPEIRIRIWQCSIPEPRLIAIRFPFRATPQLREPSSLADMLANCYDDSKPHTENSQSWRSDTPPPALLHVNAEARHEALKHYRLSLGVRDSAPRIYVDFERDTLFFGDAELERACDALWAHTPDLRLARKLAIVPEGAWRVLRWWVDMELDSLREIIFVHGSELLDHAVTLPPLIEDAVVIDEEAGVGGNERGDEIDDAEDRISSSTELALAGLEASVSATELSAQIVQQPLRDAKLQEPITTELLAQITSSERPAPPWRIRSQEADTAALKRRQDARNELEILMSVLPTLWSKEPLLTTASFRAPGVIACA